MLPKEHGAWNALIACLAAGWILLAGWNATALAATLFWLSGFILRAPISTARQYRAADPPRARRALGFCFFLLAVLLLSGFYFAENTPPGELRLVFLAATPIGILLVAMAWVKRTLRFLPAEILGFAGVSLVVPVLYLTRPGAGKGKALLLYGLFAGYFITALLYVRVRQEWLRRSRNGEKFGWRRRMADGKWVLALHLLFPAGVLMAAGGGWWTAPLYASLRASAGLFKGRPELPLMKLGLREMLHSIAFTGLVLTAFYLSA